MWTPYDVLKQRMQVHEQRAGGERGTPRAPSIVTLASQIYRTSGVKGFYVGLWAGVAVWGPYSAVFFSSYEMMRDVLAENRVALGMDQGLSGGGSDGNVVQPSNDAAVVHDMAGSGATGGDAAGNDHLGNAHDVSSRAPKDGPTSTPEELLCGVLAGAVAAAFTQPIDCIKTRYQVNCGGEGATIFSTTAQVMREGRGALFRGTAARVIWLAPGSGMTITIFEAVQRALKDV